MDAPLVDCHFHAYTVDPGDTAWLRPTIDVSNQRLIDRRGERARGP